MFSQRSQCVGRKCPNLANPVAILRSQDRVLCQAGTRWQQLVPAFPWKWLGQADTSWCPSTTQPGFHPYASRTLRTPFPSLFHREGGDGEAAALAPWEQPRRGLVPAVKCQRWLWGSPRGCAGHSARSANAARPGRRDVLVLPRLGIACVRKRVSLGK